MLIVFSIAVGIFMDGDFVGPFFMVWRRQGDFIVNGAMVFVFAENSQSFRIRILQVVDHPHASAFIEILKDGLPDLGLGEHLFNPKIIGNGKLLE